MAWTLEDDDAEVIDIRDCLFSELPSRPTCSRLIKLVLQMDGLSHIPDTFFESMPVLKVLDLSNTSLLSLPSSFFSLRMLQQFFFRHCSSFRNLPPQIGTLTKLNLLDMEGTEIIYIPKEIGNLTDLECLRISLTPFADCLKQTDEAILPRMMIQELTKLKEICISVVGSEAAWWEKEVKPIQHELCFLTNLHTLKWYFPTDKLLQEFVGLEIDGIPIYARLSNFMFTIGQPADVGYRPPSGLEKEFVKFEKCLKCINGKGDTYDISKIIASAEALYLHGRWSSAKLPLFNIERLKYCLLTQCSGMQTLVEADDETVVLGSLEYLDMRHVNDLQGIWKGPIAKDSLSRLMILALTVCGELTTIFTASLVENLVSLTELVVIGCFKVKSLVGIESCSNFKRGPYFPSLKKISLFDLPELVNISDDVIILPQLESMLVSKCPKLERLSTIELPSMKEMRGESEWWDALNCEKSEWNDIFVPFEEHMEMTWQVFEAANTLRHFQDLKLFESSSVPGQEKEDEDE